MQLLYLTVQMLGKYAQTKTWSTALNIRNKCQVSNKYQGYALLHVHVYVVY